MRSPMSSSPSRRRRTLAILGFVPCAIAALLVGTRYAGRYVAPRPAGDDFPVDEAAEADVHHFCTRCHRYPPPDTFPRDRWPEEVELGYHFARDARLLAD